MQDEHFMRQWSENHDAFSAGVTRMADKFDACLDRPADTRTALRHDQANRIFVAIVAGVLAGVTVSTVATADAAVTARAETAPILA